MKLDRSHNWVRPKKSLGASFGSLSLSLLTPFSINSLSTVFIFFFFLLFIHLDLGPSMFHSKDNYNKLASLGLREKDKSECNNQK